MPSCNFADQRCKMQAVHSKGVGAAYISLIMIINSRGVESLAK